MVSDAAALNTRGPRFLQVIPPLRNVIEGVPEALHLAKLCSCVKSMPIISAYRQSPVFWTSRG
jgi:hypothetical protein